MPGENVIWRRYANREQSALRQVGGRLFLTSQRIVFVPNRFDDATHGEAWSTALTAIASVTVEPSRRALPFPGLAAAWRRRLRIESRDGRVDLFVVNRVDDVVMRLREASGSTGGVVGAE